MVLNGQKLVETPLSLFECIRVPVYETSVSKTEQT